MKWLSSDACGSAFKTFMSLNIDEEYTKYKPCSCAYEDEIFALKEV
jgi:hypothetical protein